MTPRRVQIVGYCASCAHFRRWASERPVLGLARFGRCGLGVVPVNAGGNGMCEQYKGMAPRRLRARVEYNRG